MRSKDFSQRLEWAPEPGGGGGRPPLRVILLDDLEFGQTVSAAVTEPEKTNEVQRIRFQGSVSGGTWTITFDEQTTANLDWDATAAEVKSALEALSNIDEGDVEVWAYDGLWIVEFAGQYEETDVPLMTVASSLTGDSPRAIVTGNTIWTDSGRTVTVYGMFPDDTPTPLRSGSVAVAKWFRRLGYGVISFEPQDFSDEAY